MPEYHNVQAYLSLERRSHRDAIAMFASVLSGATASSAACDAWLSNVHRGLTFADGFGYVSNNGPQLEATVGTVVLGVRPLVLGWTPEVIPQLRAQWLEVGLLLESERIELPRLEEPRYRPELEHALFALVKTFMPISVDAPTFLTNEASDGQPWNAFVAGTRDPWAFDLAVARPEVGWPRGPLPTRFARVEDDAGTVVVRRQAWHGWRSLG